MSNNESSLSMDPSPELVGNHFIKMYYGVVLRKEPQDLYRFYSEQSTFCHASGNEPEKYVTGLKNIKSKLESLNLADAIVDLDCGSVDAQPSMDGSIVIMVTGSITLKKELPRQFAQTFFLLLKRKEEKHHFFVLNDIFRLLDTIPPVLEAAVNARLKESSPDAHRHSSTVEKERLTDIISTEKLEPKPSVVPVKTQNPSAPAASRSDAENTNTELLQKTQSHKATSPKVVTNSEKPKTETKKEQESKSQKDGATTPASPKASKKEASEQQNHKNSVAPDKPEKQAGPSKSTNSADGTKGRTANGSSDRWIPKDALKVKPTNNTSPANENKKTVGVKTWAAVVTKGSSEEETAVAENAVDGFELSSDQIEGGEPANQEHDHTASPRKKKHEHPNTVLYVSKFDMNATQEQILEVFKPFGEIVSVKLNVEKKYALVEFASIEGMNNAMTAQEEKKEVLLLNQPFSYAPKKINIRNNSFRGRGGRWNIRKKGRGYGGRHFGYPKYNPGYNRQRGDLNRDESDMQPRTNDSAQNAKEGSA